MATDLGLYSNLCTVRTSSADNLNRHRHMSYLYRCEAIGLLPYEQQSV